MIDQIHAERAVLGSLILKPENLPLVRPLLLPESFAKAEHRCVYRAILNLHDNGESITLVTVVDAVRGEVPSTDVAKLGDHTSFAIEADAKVVRANWLRRRADIGKPEDYKTPEEMLITMEAKVSELREGLMITKQSEEDRMVAKGIPELFKYLETKDDTERYIPCVLPTVTLETGGGFAPGDLVAFLGKAGHGKTTLAIQQAVYTAMRDTKVAYFTLEQSRQEILLTMLGQETGIPGPVLRRKMFEPNDWSRITSALPILGRHKISLHCQEDLNPDNLWGRMENSLIQGARFMVLDHLQLMTDGEGSEGYSYRVKHITRDLKLLAGKYGAVIWLISQQQEKSESPMAWGSQVLNQDASHMLVYQRQQDKLDEDSVWLYKNRCPGGGRPKIPVRWDKQHNKVTEEIRGNVPRMGINIKDYMKD